jgi:short-subunit dehydrogenase
MKVSGGRLDVLFNNAGVAHAGPLLEHSPAQIDSLIDVNVRGVILGAIAGHPHLQSTSGSCLLNTASAAAIYGVAGMAVYAATKAAVRSLTEALDLEWAQDGIRVRDIVPGFVDTSLLAGTVGRSSDSMREVVAGAGLEFVPLEVVAQKAWEAVHGDRVHTLVGKTARQLSFAARWTPGRLRTRLRPPSALRRPTQ